MLLQLARASAASSSLAANAEDHHLNGAFYLYNSLGPVLLVECSGISSEQLAALDSALQKHAAQAVRKSLPVCVLGITEARASKQ